MITAGSLPESLQIGVIQQLLNHNLQRDVSKVNLQSLCRGSDQKDVASSELYGFKPLTLFILFLRSWHLKLNYSQDPTWVPDDQGPRIVSNMCCMGMCVQSAGWKIGRKRQEASRMKLWEHVV